MIALEKVLSDLQMVLTAEYFDVLKDMAQDVKNNPIGVNDYEVEPDLYVVDKSYSLEDLGEKFRLDQEDPATYDIGSYVWDQVDDIRRFFQQRGVDPKNFDVEDLGEQGYLFHLTFEPKDFQALQQIKFLPEQTALKKVAALVSPHAEPTFADFQGPLLQGATVKVDFEQNPEGRMVPEPESAQLVLPTISAEDAKSIKPNFTVTVPQTFEDDKGIVKKYDFTFQVRNLKFEVLVNGKSQPKFEQKLVEFKNVY